MHFFNPPALMRLVEVVAGDRDLRARRWRSPARWPGRWAGSRSAPPTRSASSPTGRRARSRSRRCACWASGSPRTIRSTGSCGSAAASAWARSSSWTWWASTSTSRSRSRSGSRALTSPAGEPHPIQARMVAEGRLGRKAGRGYYDYGDGPHRPDDPEPADRDPGWSRRRRDRGLGPLRGLPEPGGGDAWSSWRARRRPPPPTPKPRRPTSAPWASTSSGCGDAPGLVLGRILCQIVNEAHFAVGEGVATAEDVDIAMRLGFN